MASTIFKKKISLKHLIIIIATICLISAAIFLYLQNRKLSETIEQREEEISLLLDRVSEMEEEIQNKSQKINSLQDDVQTKEATIETQQTQIANQEVEINNLNIQVSSLNQELGQTQTELQETSRLLGIAQNYEERVQQGIDLTKAYVLLGQYEKTKDIVSGITGISTPSNDSELWLRGKQIYDWLGSNYQYCSDKGFCIDETYCTQIQFFSPDELLYYGSDDVLCGDCDDKAQLFAGMMYASGVSHEKVVVACGTVPEGAHCWNLIRIGGDWYRIDPVCSDPAGFVLERFGLGFLSSSSYPSNEYRNVDCFNSYYSSSWYNPEGYYYF